MDNYFDSVDINDSKSWSSVSEPVVKSIMSEQEELHDRSSDDVNTSVSKLRSKHSAPVLTFQLIICLLILLFAFVSKSYFFGVFSNLKNLYDTEINASMYFSGNFSDIDYSGLFGASDDEI